MLQPNRIERQQAEVQYASSEELARARRKRQMDLAERGINFAQGNVDWNQIAAADVLTGQKQPNEVWS